MSFYIYNIYIYILYIYNSNIFCSFTTSQGFWQSSVPGALSTLVTSVVLYSLTSATLMSPEKEETRVQIYIYILQYQIMWKQTAYLKNDQFS